MTPGRYPGNTDASDSSRQCSNAGLSIGGRKSAGCQGRASAVAWCDRVTIVFTADPYCRQQEVRVKAPRLSEI